MNASGPPTTTKRAAAAQAWTTSAAASMKSSTRFLRSSRPTQPISTSSLPQPSRPACGARRCRIELGEVDHRRDLDARAARGPGIPTRRRRGWNGRRRHSGGEVLGPGQRLGHQPAMLDQRRAQRQPLQRRIDVGDVLAGDHDVVARAACARDRRRCRRSESRRASCRRRRRGLPAGDGSARACPPCGSRRRRRSGSGADRDAWRAGAPRSPRRPPPARRRRRGCGRAAAAGIIHPNLEDDLQEIGRARQEPARNAGASSNGTDMGDQVLARSRRPRAPEGRSSRRQPAAVPAVRPGRAAPG